MLSGIEVLVLPPTPPAVSGQCRPMTYCGPSEFVVRARIASLSPRSSSSSTSCVFSRRTELESLRLALCLSMVISAGVPVLEMRRLFCFSHVSHTFPLGGEGGAKRIAAAIISFSIVRLVLAFLEGSLISAAGKACLDEV